MTRFPRRALRMAAAAFATMLAATILVPLVQSRVALRVAVGLEDRDDYLLCREPTYRAAIVANHVLAANVHILSQEEGVLYFDRRVTLADAFRRQWGDPPPGATPMDWCTAPARRGVHPSAPGRRVRRPAIQSRFTAVPAGQPPGRLPLPLR